MQVLNMVPTEWTFKRGAMSWLFALFFKSTMCLRITLKIPKIMVQFSYLRLYSSGLSIPMERMHTIET